MIKRMEKEYINMQMEMNMKENGKIIKRMEKENIYMVMEINMMVNGKMIKKMDTENIFIRNQIIILKDIGKMIKKKVKGKFLFKKIKKI